MTAIAYLPATLLHSPTSAIALSIFLSALFFFVPVLLLSRVCSSGNNPMGSKEIVYSLLIFFGSIFLIATQFDNLAAAAFMIHADAPSLGLAGGACTILYFRRTSSNWGWLLLSASLAILSIWTKQNLLPLPFALLTYVLIADGYKAFKRYLVCYFLVTVIISIGFILAFDSQYLYFTMLKWPASWPWSLDSYGRIPGKYESWPERTAVLGSAAYELLKYSLPLLIVILYQFGCQFKQIKFVGLSKYLHDNRWFIFVIASVYMFPIAILSRVKLGGGTYSLAVSLYFLLCAVVAIASSVATSTANMRPQPKKTKAIKLLVLLAIAVLTLKNLRTEDSLTGVPNLTEFFVNPVEQAYQYNKEHPGKVYFPDFPLVAIMAEGKLYHSALGLFDRRFYESVNYNLPSDVIKIGLLERFEVENQRFRQHIPSELEFIAFPNERKMNRLTMNYLPEFSKKVELDSLSGWVVYAK
ncbi:hypothetical protein ACQ4M4_04900 [Leptolyngbya sp. AN02str]